jgi:NADH dehydrogenase
VVPAGIGLPITLAFAALLGAGFGGIFRYQAQGHAATISAGILYGLLWWIAGPLTLGPMLRGGAPTWSISEASIAFPALIVHVLYGTCTGLVFHILAAAYSTLRPWPEVPVQQEVKAMRHVIIVGGGFGGVAAAQRLEEIFARDPSVGITLVSQSNYLLFTPMLAEVASGALEPQHISAPLRACFSRARVLRAEVDAIQAAEHAVRVRTSPAGSSGILHFDHLVLALGAVPSYHGLPGLQEHSMTLKNLSDAVRLRDRVIGLLERMDGEVDPEERRRQLTFVVVGGGFAGTETVAELFDLVRGSLRYYPNIAADDLHFTLIHGGERILPEISAELAAYALQRLQARGIEIILQARVAGATPDAVLLSDGRQIPTGTLVWAAGNSPHPLISTLACEHGRGGAAVVDVTLRVEGLTDIWAVGDCAEVPDLFNEGKPHPRRRSMHCGRDGWSERTSPRFSANASRGHSATGRPVFSLPWDVTPRSLRSGGGSFRVSWHGSCGGRFTSASCRALRRSSGSRWIGL